MRTFLIDSLPDTAGTNVEITGVNTQSEVVGGWNIITINPSTLNGEDENYTITITDDTYVKVFTDGETIDMEG